MAANRPHGEPRDWSATARRDTAERSLVLAPFGPRVRCPGAGTPATLVPTHCFERCPVFPKLLGLRPPPHEGGGGRFEQKPPTAAPRVRHTAASRCQPQVCSVCEARACVSPRIARTLSSRNSHMPSVQRIVFCDGGGCTWDALRTRCCISACAERCIMWSGC